MFVFADILLQVLLSTDESLQIAAVQCVKIVLDQCPDFCKDLLAADIAGRWTLFVPMYTGVHKHWIMTF